MRTPFGYIELTHMGAERTHIVRIGKLNMARIFEQCDYDPTGTTRIVETDSFSSYCYTVQETPKEVLKKIKEHDEQYGYLVDDFNSRYGIY